MPHDRNDDLLEQTGEIDDFLTGKDPVEDELDDEELGDESISEEDDEEEDTWA